MSVLLADPIFSSVLEISYNALAGLIAGKNGVC